MVPSHLIELEDSTNIAWDIWQQMFLGIADYHAPLQKRRVRHLLSLVYSRANKTAVLKRKTKKKNSLKVRNRCNLDFL